MTVGNNVGMYVESILALNIFKKIAENVKCSKLFHEVYCYFSTNCIVLVWNKFIETNLDIFCFCWYFERTAWKLLT